MQIAELIGHRQIPYLKSVADTPPPSNRWCTELSPLSGHSSSSSGTPPLGQPRCDPWLGHLAFDKTYSAISAPAQLEQTQVDRSNHNVIVCQYLQVEQEVVEILKAELLGFGPAVESLRWRTEPSEPMTATHLVAVHQILISDFLGT